MMLMGKCCRNSDATRARGGIPDEEQMILRLQEPNATGMCSYFMPNFRLHGLPFHRNGAERVTV